jgi:hypothetical protein
MKVLDPLKIQIATLKNIPYLYKKIGPRSVQLKALIIKQIPGRTQRYGVFLPDSRNIQVCTDDPDLRVFPRGCIPVQ